MKFTVNFDCDNDAFAISPEFEVSRVLRQISKKVEDGFVNGPVMDFNGNRIGDWEFTDDDGYGINKK
jgi:hypothetical protein